MSAISCRHMNGTGSQVHNTHTHTHTRPSWIQGGPKKLAPLFCTP